MRKTWRHTVTLMVAGMLLVGMTGLGGAADTIQLVVNGRTIEADVPPQLVQDRVLVPVRWVAEALGATVRWEQASKTVRIDHAGGDADEDRARVEYRIRQLEEALAAKTPREAVESWLEHRKARNGAVEYALLLPGAREALRSQYEELNWVSGTSSPWIERFEITREAQRDDGSWEFEVELTWRTSASASEEVETVIVKQHDGHWYIVPPRD